MIICTNCGKIFCNENKLQKFIEIENEVGKTDISLYNPLDPIPEKPHDVFNGCPDCKTDAYLMEV